MYTRAGLDGLAALRWSTYYPSKQVRRDILGRYLAFPVVDPINLASTQFPFVTQGLNKLGLGEAWGQSPTYQLQAGLSSLWAAGRLGLGVLMEECDG